MFRLRTEDLTKMMSSCFSSWGNVGLNGLMRNHTLNRQAIVSVTCTKSLHIEYRFKVQQF